MAKASDNEFPSVLLAEQASAPATPASGFWRAYAKSDGLYIVDDAGAETGPFGTGPGGGGLTHTYVGTTEGGGTSETMTLKRVYMKKITLATAGVLSSVEAYMEALDASFRSVDAALFTDNAGDPDDVIASTGMATSRLLLHGDSGATTSPGGPRWYSFPMGRYLTAGDYWIAVATFQTTERIVLRKTASGTDRYYLAADLGFSDATYSANTTTTDDYSLRASVLT